MGRHRYRQLVLFLAVLILPAVLIAVQGQRLSVQERELVRARLEDTRKRTAAEIGQDIVTRLERLRTQEMANIPASPASPERPSDPAVVAVGWVDDDALVWPWDVSPATGGSSGSPEFLRALNAGRRAEYVERRDDRATEQYGLAVAAAREDSERASARLELARVQRRTGQRAAAIASYRDVLRLPSTVVDEHRLSYWSSAAGPLVELGAGRDVLARLSRDLESRAWLPPVQLYRFRTILDAVRSAPGEPLRETAPPLEQLAARLADHERAESLQRDFAKLSLAPNEWRTHKGDTVWLVGRSPDGAVARPLVMVVRWEPLLAAVESDRQARGGGPRFQIAADANGDQLSTDLPDLRITFPDGVGDLAAGLSPQRWLWGWSFAVVALLTCLSGYLLWRDVRREAHMAELRTQFVSSVSHELKTPLTSIRMFAELLQMKGADPEQARFLDTIVSESERLTRLLNNVLDFSRIERGQKTYRLEPAALRDVVQASVRAIQYPLAQQGFSLQLTVSDGIPPVAVDRDALQQAILNLLTNAMKYSGPHREIGLRLYAENGTAMIEVSDRGIGIDETEHARIFEKFYRVPIPENREISGTGLGLSLVAHIAEAHGGRVQVKSRPGEGSTFSILLPLKAGSAA
jgi:signal transduction histidine kinase